MVAMHRAWRRLIVCPLSAYRFVGHRVWQRIMAMICWGRTFRKRAPLSGRRVLFRVSFGSQPRMIVAPQWQEAR